jgi:hypothetical protein
MQNSAKIKTLATTVKEVKIEVTQLFHLPNDFSVKSVKRSFVPEFSASSLDRVVNPYRVLVLVSSGTVLFGMHVDVYIIFKNL